MEKLKKNLLPKDVYALNGLVVWKQMEWGGETGAKTPAATLAQQLRLLQDVSYQAGHFKSASKWAKHFKRNHNSVCMHKSYCGDVNKKKNHTQVIVWMQL